MHAIMTVIVLVVASYMIYNIARGAMGGLATAEAIIVTASDGDSVTGYVVRQEQVITSPYALVTTTRQEGEKVSAGAQVAISHQNQAAVERQEEQEKLEERLEQLELAKSYQTQLSDESALNERIIQQLGDFAAASGEDLQDAAQSGAELKTLILRQSLGSGDTEMLEIQIAQLRSQISALKSQELEEEGIITAGATGWYSCITDGYENLLTPETILEMTPEEYAHLEKSMIVSPSGTAGRLITDSTWYFATLVDEELVKDYGVGDKLTVDLGAGISDPVKMTIRSMNRDREGQVLMVLSCRDNISQVTTLRRQTVRLIWGMYSGLQVPKEAICYSEDTGSAGVYVLDGAKAVWKDVELLYDTGDHYVVAMDVSSTKNLWPEDQILLDTEDLYNGKVLITS